MKRIATTLLIAGLMATPMLALPPPADAAISVGISVNIAPPPLPVYEQPIAPGPGYIWTPGYWAWDPAYGYYWVPGTWVMPPEIGLLWTPGWWGWSDGYYRWHAGYWGPRVGFYGGINYGYGYFGTGYVGGQWRGRDFYYNRAVNNINVTNVRNVYVNRTVVNNVHVNRVSYNGGRGGLRAQPTAAQRTYANQRRSGPTSMQTRQRETAMRDPAQRFKTNQGRPAVFATQRAGSFSGAHAVRASGGPQLRSAAHPESRNGHLVQAPHNRTAAPQRTPMNAAPNRPQRGHAAAPPPRNERAPVNAPRPQVQGAHPNARPQPEMQHQQRPQPNVRQQPSPRSGRGAPRHEPQAHGKQGKKPPPKSSDGH
ncbi:MAG TPA: hypothetical protein VFI32_08325 [Rhodanobacteraceae bacterium]|nr:hypothetical protein [Rhodanobacteraceae bacterium]